MSKGIAAVILLHVAATLAMTGLIWFVQIVHYPLFLKIPPTSFPSYEAAHTVRTGWVVAPWMLLELVSGLFLSWISLSTDGDGLWGNAASPVDGCFLANVALLIAIWLVTFFLQVPQHQALTRHFDFGQIRSLVLGNWIRTILWTARSVILLWILWDRFPARGI